MPPPCDASRGPPQRSSRRRLVSVFTPRLLFLPLHSFRTLINSTRASCQSSPPWRPSTPRPRPAGPGEARAAKGTPRTLEGLHPFTRNSCSRAGEERQTTAPSPPSSDSPTAPATRRRGAPTAGRGRGPQSSLFLFFFSILIL